MLNNNYLDFNLENLREKNNIISYIILKNYEGITVTEEGEKVYIFHNYKSISINTLKIISLFTPFIVGSLFFLNILKFDPIGIIFIILFWGTVLLKRKTKTLLILSEKGVEIHKVIGKKIKKFNYDFEKIEKLEARYGRKTYYIDIFTSNEKKEILGTLSSDETDIILDVFEEYRRKKYVKK